MAAELILSIGGLGAGAVIILLSWLDYRHTNARSTSEAERDLTSTASQSIRTPEAETEPDLADVLDFEEVRKKVERSRSAVKRFEQTLNETEGRAD